MPGVATNVNSKSDPKNWRVEEESKQRIKTHEQASQTWLTFSHLCPNAEVERRMQGYQDRDRYSIGSQLMPVLKGLWCEKSPELIHSLLGRYRLRNDDPAIGITERYWLKRPERPVNVFANLDHNNTAFRLELRNILLRRIRMENKGGPLAPPLSPDELPRSWTTINSNDDKIPRISLSHATQHVQTVEYINRDDRNTITFTTEIIFPVLKDSTRAKEWASQLNGYDVSIKEKFIESIQTPAHLWMQQQQYQRPVWSPSYVPVAYKKPRMEVTETVRSEKDSRLMTEHEEKMTKLAEDNSKRRPGRRKAIPKPCRSNSPVKIAAKPGFTPICASIPPVMTYGAIGTRPQPIPIPAPVSATASACPILASILAPWTADMEKPPPAAYPTISQPHPALMQDYWSAGLNQPPCQPTQMPMTTPPPMRMAPPAMTMTSQDVAEVQMASPASQLDPSYRINDDIFAKAMSEAGYPVSMDPDPPQCLQKPEENHVTITYSSTPMEQGLQADAPIFVPAQKNQSPSSIFQFKPPGY